MPKRKRGRRKKEYRVSSGKEISMTKGPWTVSEDETLQKLVKKYGPRDWATISANMQKYGIWRVGKQCRERWFNHLDPSVRKDPWSEEEDQIIVRAHSKLGNKWTDISKLLDGRPANAVKNHWNSTLRRQFESHSGRRQKRKRKRVIESASLDDSSISSSSSSEYISQQNKRRRIRLKAKKQIDLSSEDSVDETSIGDNALEEIAPDNQDAGSNNSDNQDTNDDDNYNAMDIEEDQDVCMWTDPIQLDLGCDLPDVSILSFFDQNYAKFLPLM
eukprot:TRINITY_DN3095_c0_g1_i1.p1 TRINITY_DN3095_c0_g1~~TRINITY_DN3095_c0_g1_i1.p1  ORF type:complete len:273 (+),score=66.69 TRINITY_DN3095_c0_g1_i1:55-873(+)